ncbi:hypothetical protein F5B21DRAFT_507400 [Xylaria acuta]|nr:hypothetical protein F5B21DRAFT_507400 [Xylaria acuta]
MPFRSFFTKIGTASQRARAYRELGSSQEHLLPATAPMAAQQDFPEASELPNYKSLISPPEYQATAPHLPGQTASLTRRLAQIFMRRASDKKLAPVSPEHRATLERIAQAVAEINLGHELQAAIDRQRRLESTWDVAQESSSPSELNGEFDERMDVAHHVEALYNRLTTIIGADIGPQMCLPGAPRAELVGQKLGHLRKLESLQRDLADCTARTERCQWASACPRYSGMSPAGIIKLLGELTLWRGAITSRISEVKLKLAFVDYRMKEMINMGA